MTPSKDYYDPPSVADFLATVGVDARTGLARDAAATRRALHGANRVTPPVNCPSWVCCLLPCLLRVPSMVAYQEALPREATVRRLQANGKPRRLRMDAASLVYGDVVEVKAGEFVGADLRVIECSDDCLVDQELLVGGAHEDDEPEEDLEAGESTSAAAAVPRRLKKVTTVATDTSSALVCGNVLPMATQVARGSAVGVVIATGDATVWGQLLQNHAWPVKGATTKRANYATSAVEAKHGEANALVGKV